MLNYLYAAPIVLLAGWYWLSKVQPEPIDVDDDDNIDKEFDNRGYVVVRGLETSKLPEYRKAVWTDIRGAIPSVQSEIMPSWNRIPVLEDGRIDMERVKFNEVDSLVGNTARALFGSELHLANVIMYRPWKLNSRWRGRPYNIDRSIFPKYIVSLVDARAMTVTRTTWLPKWLNNFMFGRTLRLQAGDILITKIDFTLRANNDKKNIGLVGLFVELV